MIDFYGFLFISILGTLFHFTYDASGHDKYVSLFSAVNESVWEHMKLVVFPSLVWLLIEIPFSYKNPNFLTSKCISLISMILLIPTLFYIMKKLFKKNIFIIDILIFYISIGVGQYLSYLIKNNILVEPTFNYISLIILIMVYGYFLIATFLPGKSDIYTDPITKKKGFKGHH